MPTAKKKIERIDAVRKQAAVHDEKPEGIDRRQTVPRCRGYDQFAMARRKRSGTMIRPLFDWPALFPGRVDFRIVPNGHQGRFCTERNDCRKCRA